MYTFERAEAYCDKLGADGHGHWRVPTFIKLSLVAPSLLLSRLLAELNMLLRECAAIGGFNKIGFYAQWYWSSTEDGSYFAWGQRFSDGAQIWDNKNFDSSLRCVR